MSRTGAQHPLRGGLAPAWAVEWGEDRRGAFAAFAVGAPGAEVEQRMRWISPGTFVMGSPETELGRRADEGPQHEVTLTQGYWLGETPVTQAFWVAIMGANPSRITGNLQRPVEQVSWADCQEFLGRVNAQVVELAARLPTEAEWERACRGGMPGATWIGELSGEQLAPELDPIAWYAGNSEGPRPVRGKGVNPYGLYDMLGNVSEWCADAGLREYTAEPVKNPFLHHGSRRVHRGGAWSSRARGVRAADRDARERDRRLDCVGLRLAAGQAALPAHLPAVSPRRETRGTVTRPTAAEVPMLKSINPSLSPSEWALLQALVLDEPNHTGIPSAEPVVKRLGMPFRDGRDHLESLELLQIVRLQQLIGALPHVQVLWRGREVAHARGEPIASPIDDARDLLAFLRDPGNDLHAGSEQVNDDDIVRRFGWPQARALDAARVLDDHQMVKLHTPLGGSFFLFLKPLGRRAI